MCRYVLKISLIWKLWTHCDVTLVEWQLFIFGFMIRSVAAGVQVHTHALAQIHTVMSS